MNIYIYIVRDCMFRRLAASPPRPQVPGFGAELHWNQHGAPDFRSSRTGTDI